MDSGVAKVVQTLNPEWIDHVFDPIFVSLVRKGAYKWWPIPLGNARAGYDVLPGYLMTNICLQYTQKEKNQCLYKCVASALHYIGLKSAASFFSMRAPVAQSKAGHFAIKEVRQMMQTEAPVIGDCVMYNKKNKKGKINPISLDEILENKTIFPTLIVPVGQDKSVNHAVCVVDDLIFDSTQLMAFKLTKESFDWICGGEGVSCIGEAYRFNRGHATKKKLDRNMNKNW